MPPDIKNTDSMNIILLQELNRYNKLIGVIRLSLSSIKDALNGLIVFSFDLEDALNFIKINKVPKTWMESSYPSLKPLPAYIDNLKQRIAFFNKWLDEGKPPVFWISGFFFPQGFLTGILQNYARKYTIAIDKLVYDYEVLPEHASKAQAPEDGCYVDGFYLEGAKFDYDRMSLAESDPKVAPPYDRSCLYWVLACSSSPF
jgi:dynein heavy chain